MKSPFMVANAMNGYAREGAAAPPILVEREVSYSNGVFAHDHLFLHHFQGLRKR